MDAGFVCGVSFLKRHSEEWNTEDDEALCWRSKRCSGLGLYRQVRHFNAVTNLFLFDLFAYRLLLIIYRHEGTII